MQGGVGWQGIIPSRAAKMGSIAVDRGIAKLGSPSEFYQQLEPEAIAEQILATARHEIREVVDRTMEREYPDTWHGLPRQVREVVHLRVQQRLPDVVRTVTDEIWAHIDQLVDIKLMVIRRIEGNPEIANRNYPRWVARARMIINFGFFFGALRDPGRSSRRLPNWWVLPIRGVIVGYVTNWVALWMIFEPLEPRRIGPFRVAGLFIRRQPEVSDVYGRIVAEEIVTVRNFGEELLRGPQADRTR